MQFSESLKKNEQFRFAFAMYIGLLNYFNLPYEL